MEENRKGPGIFYAVVGVATLVVAIIGATFAYFSATAPENTDTVKGQTATAANITLAVEQVSPTTENLKGTQGRMLPLDTAKLGTALTKNCVDDNGYVACQVYKVTVSNGTGGDPVRTSTSVQLINGTIANLRWQKATSATAVDSGFSAVDTHTSATELASNTDGINGGESDVYYFVVWLENQETDQSASDAGKTFTGTVSVNMVGLDGKPAGNLKATFTA